MIKNTNFPAAQRHLALQPCTLAYSFFYSLLSTRALSPVLPCIA